MSRKAAVKPEPASAAPSGTEPVGAAFQRLLLAFHYKGPAAAERLNAAVRTNEVRLFLNGDVVDPDFFAAGLRIAACAAADGRWHAEIAGCLPGSLWTVLRHDVNQLIRREKASKGRPVKEEARSRGRKVEFKWDELLAEVIRRVHEDGIPDSDRKLADELVEWCGQQNFEDIPQIDTVRKKLAIWLSRVPRGN